MGRASKTTDVTELELREILTEMGEKYFPDTKQSNQEETKPQ